MRGFLHNGTNLMISKFVASWSMQPLSKIMRHPSNHTTGEEGSQHIKLSIVSRNGSQPTRYKHGNDAIAKDHMTQDEGAVLVAWAQRGMFAGGGPYRQVREPPAAKELGLVQLPGAVGPAVRKCTHKLGPGLANNSQGQLDLPCVKAPLSLGQAWSSTRGSLTCRARKHPRAWSNSRGS